MFKRTCDFCNSTLSSHIYEDNWKIVKCKSCGFVYTNPIPPNISEYYEKDYFKDIRHKKSFYNEDGSPLKEGIFYKNRIEIIENFVNKRGSLLEVGAANGAFLKQMKERGWSVSGVEISKEAVAMASDFSNLELFCGDYLDYQMVNKFDVIAMFQTLEHLSNPKKILEKTFKELNTHGVLVIEVPNFNGWDIKFSKEKKQLVYDLPRHLNHFTPFFLKRELEKIGFEIHLIDRYYPNFILDLFKNRNKKNKEVQIKTDNIKKELSLSKINKTWKGKLLDLISIFLPGWKFTIVAIKK